MYMVNVLGSLVSVISVVGGILTLQLKTSSLLLPILGVGLILVGIICYVQFTSKLDYGVNFPEIPPKEGQTLNIPSGRRIG